MPDSGSHATGAAVLLLYNRPRASSDVGETRPESDAGVLDQVRAVEGALVRLGHPVRAKGVASLAEARAVLGAAPERLVFNLVESLPGDVDDSNLVPALCRAFAKACTGNPTGALLCSLDKWVARCLLLGDGVRVPEGMLVRPGAGVLVAELPAPPWIVKPVKADASEGIDAECSVVRDEAGLRRAVTAVHESFGQAALVERLVGRRELNVSVLEVNGEVTVLPIAEIDFSALPSDRPPIVDYAAKWLESSFEYKATPRILPAPLDDDVAEAVRDLARKSFRALCCRGYARVDMRLDEVGQPVVLEVNPNPDVGPEAGLTAALAAAGMSYKAFVAAMLRGALDAGAAGNSPEAASAEPAAGEPTTRLCEPADVEPLVALTEATGMFTPGEVDVAREVIEQACADGPSGHYRLRLAEAGGEVAGWVCTGPTPCTESTHDLYWIAVAPALQGRGLGRRLVEWGEADILERGGALCVVETAGRADYEPTRRFYDRIGYRVSARIPDFYAPGDDKVVFVRRLAG